MNAVNVFGSLVFEVEAKPASGIFTGVVTHVVILQLSNTVLGSVMICLGLLISIFHPSCSVQRIVFLLLSQLVAICQLSHQRTAITSSSLIFTMLAGFFQGRTSGGFDGPFLEARVLILGGSSLLTSPPYPRGPSE